VQEFSFSVFVISTTLCHCERSEAISSINFIFCHPECNARLPDGQEGSPRTI